MTAARIRCRRASSRLAHLMLIASVLLGLAAMHGASAATMSVGGHGPVSLPVAMDVHAAQAAADAHADVAVHQLAAPMGQATATPAAGDVGSHHSLSVACALALTGILTLALAWLVGRYRQRLVQRLDASRTDPRLADRLQRAATRPVPRFSLCVLRT